MSSYKSVILSAESHSDIAESHTSQVIGSTIVSGPTRVATLGTPRGLKGLRITKSSDRGQALVSLSSVLEKSASGQRSGLLGAIQGCNGPAEWSYTPKSARTCDGSVCRAGAPCNSAT